MGYGDDYVPALEGQSIDVTGLPGGRYLLVHRVNATASLLESEYDNNQASVVVELPGNRSPTRGVEMETDTEARP